MNRSELVSRRVGDPPLKREQLDAVISALQDGLAERLGEVDHESAQRDVYMLLHPDVRRLLVQLGQPENRKFLLALLKAGEEEADLLFEMMRDYKEARKLGTYLKKIFVVMGGFLSVMIAVVKGAPDFLDWLRGLLAK